MTVTTRLKKFIADKQGNIAITFAIAMLPLTLSIGAAVDYSQSAQLHSKIASATDAALLSAATIVMEDVDLTNEKAVLKILNKEFEPFFLANMPSNYRSKYRGTKISYDPKTGKIGADVDYDFRTTVLGIAGIDKLDISVAAATRVQKSAGGAVSMFLVLDRSGSMSSSAGGGGSCPWWRSCGPSKMDSLKTAVASMAAQFEAIDPTHKFARMGAVSYHSSAQKESKIAWGTSAVNAYVQRLPASGGTNSSKAVKKAHNALKHSRENKEHQKKSGQDPQKVMVFMTDGSNNRSSYDYSTIKTCTKAKKEKIEIYTVAFQAPSRGQKLLKSCATDGSHYFNATNTSDLIAAFKKIGASVSEKLVLTE